MDISCDVSNYGTAAGGTSNLAYYLSDDAIYDAGDTDLFSVCSTFTWN